MKPAQKLIVILWADLVSDAGQVAKAITASGHRCLLRNASGFTPNDFEPAHAFVVHQAHREADIRAVYASKHVPEMKIEASQLVAVEGGAPLQPLPPVSEKSDFLEERLRNMPFEDLRTYVRGITGTDPPGPRNDPPNDEDTIAVINVLRTFQGAEPLTLGSATDDDSKTDSGIGGEFKDEEETTTTSTEETKQTETPPAGQRPPRRR